MFEKNLIFCYGTTVEYDVRRLRRVVIEYEGIEFRKFVFVIGGF